MPKWKCYKGQGEDGKSIKSLGGITRDACGQKCLEFDGCIAIDYTDTKTSKKDQCRLYNDNTPRTDPGTDGRVYCTENTAGKKEFD